MFGKKEMDTAVGPFVEAMREPLTVELWQHAAPPSTNPTNASRRTPILAIGNSARIAIKANRRILFMNTADLVAVEAKGNHVLLVRTSGSHALRESISTIEEKLNLYGFVRIHRSVLVNAALVEEIHPRSTGEFVLRVRGGREFTVTRTYKKNLQRLAQLWIGMDGFAGK